MQIKLFPHERDWKIYSGLACDVPVLCAKCQLRSAERMCVSGRPGGGGGGGGDAHCYTERTIYENKKNVLILYGLF